MSLLGLLTFTLGPSIAKAILKTLLKDKEVLVDVYCSENGMSDWVGLQELEQSAMLRAT
jgi:hypothetical protein